MGISHVERVENRTDTEIALVLASEILSDAVEHIVADGIPENILGKVFLLRGVPCNGILYVSFLLVCTDDALLLLGQWDGTNFRHQGSVGHVDERV